MDPWTFIQMTGTLEVSRHWDWDSKGKCKIRIIARCIGNKSQIPLSWDKMGLVPQFKVLCYQGASASFIERALTFRSQPNPSCVLARMGTGATGKGSVSWLLLRPTHRSRQVPWKFLGGHLTSSQGSGEGFAEEMKLKTWKINQGAVGGKEEREVFVQIGTAKFAPRIKSISICLEVIEGGLLDYCHILLSPCVDICTNGSEAMVGKTAGTLAWISVVALSCSHFVLHCHKAPAVLKNAVSLVEGVIIFIKLWP